MPAVADWQATVAVCGEAPKVTLVGAMAPQESPAGTVSVNATVPVNPLSAVRVIVEVAEVLMTTAAGDVALMVKSRIVNVAVVEWARAPLVPVIVRT